LVEDEFMRKAWLVMVGIALGAGSGISTAQTLQVPETATAPVAMSGPARGMSMTEVEARYGAPKERYAAVGQPPITRWVYPSFVVYFEYSHVVHAVAIQASAGTS
jgi:hypothetical protein